MSTNTLSLIRDSKQGSETAKERLFSLIIKEHMPSRIQRKKGRNVLISDAEVESEFLVGCLKALRTVKMDVGNPLLYILWKGDMEVSNLFRERIESGVVARCLDCKTVRRVLIRRGRPLCRSCGSAHISTFMREQLESFSPGLPQEATGVDSVVWDRLEAEDAETVFYLATGAIQTEEIRSLLNGRVLQLFDILVIEGVNHESSRNYLKEIAERWGVTTAAVSVYLRKLRAAVERYYGEGA